MIFQSNHEMITYFGYIPDWSELLLFLLVWEKEASYSLRDVQVFRWHPLCNLLGYSPGSVCLAANVLPLGDTQPYLCLRPRVWSAPYLIIFHLYSKPWALRKDHDCSTRRQDRGSRAYFYSLTPVTQPPIYSCSRTRRKYLAKLDVRATGDLMTCFVFVSFSADNAAWKLIKTTELQAYLSSTRHLAA